MPKPVNHILHIILSVLTGGLWLFVYIPILIRYGRRNKAYAAAVTRERKAQRAALLKHQQRLEELAKAGVAEWTGTPVTAVIQHVEGRRGREDVDWGNRS